MKRMGLAGGFCGICFMLLVGPVWGRTESAAECRGEILSGDGVGIPYRKYYFEGEMGDLIYKYMAVARGKQEWHTRYARVEQLASQTLKDAAVARQLADWGFSSEEIDQIVGSKREETGKGMALKEMSGHQKFLDELERVAAPLRERNPQALAILQKMDFPVDDSDDAFREEHFEALFKALNDQDYVICTQELGVYHSSFRFE